MSRLTGRRLADSGDVERGGILRNGSRFSCQWICRFIPVYPAVEGDPLHVDGAVFSGDGEEAGPDLGPLQRALRYRALTKRWKGRS